MSCGIKGAMAKELAVFGIDRDRSHCSRHGWLYGWAGAAAVGQHFLPSKFEIQNIGTFNKHNLTREHLRHRAKITQFTL